MNDCKEIIKSRVSCREMAERVGVHVDRAGMAKCPFHPDGDASLKIYRDERRGWHCYGCGAGGDVIDFARMYFGVSFKQAMREIDGLFALGLPLDRRMTDDEKRQMHREIEQARKERERRKAACDAAEAAYWRACDAWLLVDEAVHALAPECPEEPMSEAFIWALMHRDEITENLLCAEEEWRKAREREREPDRDPQQR